MSCHGEFGFACREEVADPFGQVRLVGVVLGEPQQQGVHGVPELLLGLLGLDDAQLLLHFHCVAGGEEVVEQHRDADLEENPVDQYLRRGRISVLGTRCHGRARARQPSVK